MNLVERDHLAERKNGVSINYPTLRKLRPEEADALRAGGKAATGANFGVQEWVLARSTAGWIAFTA